jgi:hypothetical protein
MAEKVERDWEQTRDLWSLQGAGRKDREGRRRRGTGGGKAKKAKEISGRQEDGEDLDEPSPRIKEGA